MIEVDDYSTTHSTKHEMKFIDGLGKWAPELRVSRQALLAGYLAAAFKRINWGSIDPTAIIYYATLSLQEAVPNPEVYENG